MGRSESTMASPRVGAAWRALGPHAREFYRASLAEDIETLREAVERADAIEQAFRRGRRMTARERQYLKLLAATY
jgi:hypothetical protein